MEKTINIKEIYTIIKKFFLIIVIISMGTTIASAIINIYFITPIYQASTQILVNQKKQDGIIQPGEVQSNIQLTNTYKKIIKSPIILEQIKQKLKLNISIQHLSKQIDVENEKDSQIIIINVQNESLKFANEIANAAAEIFKNEIAKIMSIDNVTILSQAGIITEEEPIRPKIILNIGITFSISLILVVGILFLVENLDNTLKKEEDIEKHLELPILGNIPHIDKNKKYPQNKIITTVKKERGNTIDF